MSSKLPKLTPKTVNAIRKRFRQLLADQRRERESRPASPPVLYDQDFEEILTLLDAAANDPDEWR